MTLLFLTAHAALAFPADCPSAYVDRIAPADGAVDVPLSAQIQVGISSDCYDGGLFDARLLHDDVEVASWSITHEAGTAGRVYSFDPGGLEPEADYTLTVVDGFESVVESQFTTGTDWVATPPAAPTLMVEATETIDGAYDIAMQATYSADAGPGSAMVLRVLVTNDPGFSQLWNGAPTLSWYAFAPAAPVLDEICVEAVQRSLSGLESAVVTECVTPEPYVEAGPEGCGCSQGGSSAPFLFLLLPLFLRRSR